MYKTREEVENWLKEMEVKNYIINEDLKVDVNKSVILSGQQLINIPIQFGMVNGDFYCSNNKLTSLEGCPKEVFRNFDCSNNLIKSLKHCPEKIRGGFSCNDNELENLKYFPKVLNDGFYCRRNNFTSLEGCPKEINGTFDCSYNRLKSLEGGPEVINGNFYLRNNCLTNFEYFPKEIKGSCLNFTGNNIKEKELLNFNCNIILASEIFSDFNNNGNKEEFLGKVNYYKTKKENELLKELNINKNNMRLNNKL